MRRPFGMNREQVVQFWARIDRRGRDECWPWKNKNGRPHYDYGSMNINGKRRQATHVVLTLTSRPKPGRGMLALHSCDNPPCCNPAHLRWGTHQENMRDKARRTRELRLSDEWIDHILSLGIDEAETRRRFRLTPHQMLDLRAGALARGVPGFASFGHEAFIQSWTV
jgi:hypothetical protein